MVSVVSYAELAVLPGQWKSHFLLFPVASHTSISAKMLIHHDYEVQT